MKLFLLATLASLHLVPALAQASGEADPAQSRAPPIARFTAAERIAADRERFANGSLAAQRMYGSDLQQPVPVVTLSHAEREAAALQRWNEVTALNKAGLLPLSSDLDYPPMAR